MAYNSKYISYYCYYYYYFFFLLCLFLFYFFVVDMVVHVIVCLVSRSLFLVPSSPSFFLVPSFSFLLLHHSLVDKLVSGCFIFVIVSLLHFSLSIYDFSQACFSLISNFVIFHDCLCLLFFHWIFTARLPTGALLPQGVSFGCLPVRCGCGYGVHTRSVPIP